MSLRGHQRQEFSQKVRKRVALPALAVVRHRLAYNPLTGEFSWRTKGQMKAGTIAGTIDRKGYRIIKIGSAGFKAHRLAWLYMTGVEPAGDIDHKNGKKADNRWENLREANQSQNTANSRVRRDNLCGLKGVSRVTGVAKWQARIRLGGRLRHLGSFDTPELAHAAYLDAAAHLFGEFANGGSR